MKDDIKLHLGCWHRFIPGFIHIDLCDMKHIDYKSGIDDLSMFADNSVSLIYASHNFEYFNREEAIKVLKEWGRVLIPSGILRVAVPDFDCLIEVYHKSQKIENILGPLYGKMETQTQNETLTLYHKTVYNFDSLKEMLTDNGFTNVKKYKWQDTIHKSYDDHSQSYYPHMDKNNGILISLNVESTKL